MARLLAILLVAVSFAGCRKLGEGTAVISTVPTTWTLVSASFVRSTPFSAAVEAPLQGSAATVLISGDAAACESVNQRKTTGDPEFLIRLANIDATGQATPGNTVGIYPIQAVSTAPGWTPTEGLAAFVYRIDSPAACRTSSLLVPVEAGDVTVIDWDGIGIDGTFDFTLDVLDPSNSVLSGGFDAQPCSPLGRSC